MGVRVCFLGLFEGLCKRLLGDELQDRSELGIPGTGDQLMMLMSGVLYTPKGRVRGCVIAQQV